jgi:hypothetical protein
MYTHEVVFVAERYFIVKPIHIDQLQRNWTCKKCTKYIYATSVYEI